MLYFSVYTFLYRAPGDACKAIHVLLMFLKFKMASSNEPVLAGSPMPKAKWRKNGQQVEVSMDQTPDFCRVKLKAVKRGDSGEYELELKNEMGEDRVPITVKVIGKRSSKCPVACLTSALIFQTDLPTRKAHSRSRTSSRTAVGCRGNRRRTTEAWRSTTTKWRRWTRRPESGWRWGR